MFETPQILKQFQNISNSTLLAIDKLKPSEVSVQQNKRLSSAHFPKFPFNLEKPYTAAVEPTSPLFKISPDPKLTRSNSYFARCPQYQGDLFPLPRPRETHLTFSPRAASLCPPVPPLASRDEGISAAFSRLTRRQLAN